MTDPLPHSESELSELISSIDVKAPAELHLRIQAMADDASARRSRTGRNPLAPRLGAGTVALAVLVLALILVLGSSGSGALDDSRTAAFTLAGTERAAPGENPGSRAQLEANVEGISFPYWGGRFGWEASGSRVDRYGGRTIRTVFYTDSQGRRIGYAIVAGGPAPSAGSGAVHYLHGTPYHLSTADGAGVVSWIRDGHLCVLAGRDVPAATLLALASWREPAGAA
jgi:hypothetical protein